MKSKSKVGILCIISGVLLILGAVTLAWWNQREDNAAMKAAAQIMQQIQGSIDVNTESELELQKPLELLTEEEKKMKEVEIDGNLYIGYVSIPALNIELPVMSSWSYEQLRISPCRYSGSLRGEDLVLMAHNYKSHFGTIDKLEIGDNVFFTDMDGKTTAYAVVGTDILNPSAVETITAGEYDLTLFTCTYGGSNRATVYCDFVK